MFKMKSISRKAPRPMWGLMFVLLMSSLVLSACAPLEAWLTIEPVAVDTVDGEQPAPVVEFEQALEIDPDAPRLLWQGALEDGACGQVTVTADGAGLVGACNAESAGAPWLPVHATEWGQIEAHFDALASQWGDETLQLQGQGTEMGTVWAEALGVWARFVYLESTAGRSGSAARTALAWQLPATVAGGDAQTCGRLTVTGYGYAYAALEPCGGGASGLAAEGWLTTAEMAQLAEWLQLWTPLYVEAGYVDGQGDTDTSDPATRDTAAANVATWSEGVYARLVGE